MPSSLRLLKLLQAMTSEPGVPPLSMIATFERAARDVDPPLADYLSGEGAARHRLLVELTHSALELGIRAGRFKRLADYVQEYPELAASHNDLIALIETEVRGLILAGQKPQADAYEAAHPALGTAVREIFRLAGVIPTLPGYEVFEELGRGGMGVVYRARQSDLHRDVALKLVRPDRLANGAAADRYRSRFRREAAAVATVNHPHVVHVYEAGEATDGSLFLAMELVDGPSLQKRLETDGVLDPRAAAELIEKVAKAVAAVHTRGIVHRDLKPDNVLLTSTGEPKVADFGLAKPLVPSDGCTEHATQAGVVVGTPEYMSPEQAALSGEEPTPLVDVYGLGAVLYACLTGRPPVPRHAAVLATLEGVRTQEVAAIRSFRQDCPKDLETICLKCLEKDPTRRYHSAKDLFDDLRRFLDQRPIFARPAGTLERCWKWLKRNPVLATSLFAIVSGLGVGIWSIIHTTNERAARIEAESKTEIEKTQAALQTEQAEARKLEKERAEKRSARLLDLGKIRPSLAAWLTGNPTRAMERLNEIKPEHRGWEWRHLDHSYRSNGALPLRGHQGEINQLYFADNGKLIVTGGRDGTVRVWDSATANQKYRFKLKQSTLKVDDETVVLDSEIKWLRVGPNNKERMILALSREGTLLVGELHTGKVLTTVDSLEQPRSLTISPDWQRVGIAKGISRESVTIVELATGKLLYPWSSVNRNLLQPSKHREGNTNLHKPVLAKAQELMTKLPDNEEDKSDSRTYAAVSPDCLFVAELVVDKKGSLITVFDVTRRSVIYQKVIEGSPLRRSSDGGDSYILEDLNKNEYLLNENTEPQSHNSILKFDTTGKQLIVRRAEQLPLVMDSRNGSILKQETSSKCIPSDAVAWLDDRLVATILAGNRVQVINLRNPNDIQILAGCRLQGSNLLFCPQGQRLAAISPTSVSMWDLRAGVLSFTHKRQPSVNFLNDSQLREKLVFAPNGREYALLEDDSIITLRDAQSGVVNRTLLGHHSFIRRVKYSPDSRYLAVIGEDAYVWDLQRPLGPSIGSQLIGKLQGPVDFSALLAEAVIGVSASKYEDPQIDTTGRQLHKRMFHGRGLWLRTLDLNSGKSQISMRVGNGKAVTSWSCFGKMTVLGHEDGTVSVHDTSSAVVSEWNAHTSPVQQVAVDPSGRIIATSSARTRPQRNMRQPEKITEAEQEWGKVWDPKDGPQGDHPGFNEVLPPPYYDIEWAVWDRKDGRKLAVGQVEGHRPVSKIEFLNGSASLAIRCEQQMIATDGQSTEGLDFELHVFDLATGNRSFQMECGHRDSPFGHCSSRLALSPDGRTVAVSTVEGKVHVTDGPSRRVRLVLSAHPKWVTGLVIDPPGQRLVTAGAEGSVRIWDLDTGLEIFTLQEPGGERVTSLTFSRDGCWLFGTTLHGQVITWQASPFIMQNNTSIDSYEGK